jgi:hypothetical protein
MKDVGESLSSKLKTERAESRHCFLQILSALKFLARQGIALRGHENKESNFYQLLLLLAEDDPKLSKWLQTNIVQATFKMKFYSICHYKLCMRSHPHFNKKLLFLQ